MIRYFPRLAKLLLGRAWRGPVRGATVAVATGTISALSPAQAQTTDETVLLDVPILPGYDKGRNVSVMDRARPDYDPLGIRAGSFDVFPTLRTGIGVSDNIFLSTGARTGDTFAKVAPSVQVRSDFARHELIFRGGADFDRYFSHPRRNQDAWNLGALGRLDVTPEISLTAEGQLARLYESPFASDADAASSVLSSYTRAFGSLRAVRTTGRLRATLVADRTELEFRNIDFGGGNVLDQSDRDRVVYRFVGRLDRALTPSVSVYGQAGIRNTKYDRPLLSGLPNRDSQDIRVMAGISMDLAGLLRGQLGLGFVQRDFDAAAYRSITAFSAEARLDYFLTDLTTFSLRAGHTLQDGNGLSGAAFRDTRATVRMDHELLRNLILSVNGGISHQVYVDSPLKNRVLQVSGGGKYLMSRLLNLEAQIGYTDRRNFGVATAKFHELSAILSVVVHR